MRVKYGGSFSIDARFLSELPSGGTRGPSECILETEVPVLRGRQ